jgi:hypothetical protein
LKEVAMGRLIALLIFMVMGLSYGGQKEITAYYNPKCTCCHKYFKILEQKGYRINRVELDYPLLYAKKDRLGVPVNQRSCHTMEIDGKFIEGHVPVKGIEELLKTKDAKGVFSPHGNLSGWGKEESTYYLIR